MTKLHDLLGRKEIEVLDRNVHINAKEARNNFSEIMHVTDFKEMRVVITHRGKPKMALVPISDLELLEKLDRKGAQGSVVTERVSPNISKDHGGTVLSGAENETGRSGRVQRRKAHAR